MMNNSSQTSTCSSYEVLTMDYNPKYQANRVASILKTFLDDIDFVPSGNNPVNETVENYMRELIHSRGLKTEPLEQMIHLCSSLIELSCNKSSVEEKKNLALFNWFSIYIDDRVIRDPVPFREFSPRLLRRQPQLDPVLEEYTEVLDRMWDIFDPMIANTIFNHTIAFVLGCCVEPELDKTPLKHGVDRFPWYIRELTGLGIPYSIFPFVKRGNFDMMKLIQAIPDMNFWTCLTNDLLSFHKEELANEIGTYISNRAQNDNKSRYETCAEIVTDLKQARKNIHAVLADNPALLELWKVYEIGYIEWHLIQERYRLKDLGIMIS